jgi:hypothetical protein
LRYLFIEVWNLVCHWYEDYTCYHSSEQPPITALSELLKLVKFPLLDTDFLVEEVIPYLESYRLREFREIIAGCVSYQTMLAKAMTIELCGSQTLKYTVKKQVLLMQSTLCDDNILDWNSFQPRPKSSLVSTKK